jgi:imidazolonepropionase-like amidohydrolase
MTVSWVRAALVVGLLGAADAACAETVVLRGGSIYATPEAAPLTDAVVIATDGVISAVGKSGEVKIPQDARVIDCTGKTIVAGFWNSHVHLTEAVWHSAADGPAAPLTQHMQEMLTRWGFTSVWDLGSNPAETLPLRKRIAAGEIAGPNIFLLGSIFPKDGHPAYLPAEMQLPEAATPEEATKLASVYMSLGLDGVKLFTGSYKGNAPVVNMDPAIAKAAVDVSHAEHKPVFAHPQNMTGVDTVIAAGVDVMAHTVPGAPGYSEPQLAKFKQQGIALIPTLSLFANIPGAGPEMSARLVASTVAQLKAFSDNGGPVLFGTDVGFTPLYDTTLEYELMHRALSERQVLASLTTSPAQYFKAGKKGRVEQGLDADLVVLDGDPLSDVRNLARVAYTIRAGHVIYQKP